MKERRSLQRAERKQDNNDAYEPEPEDDADIDDADIEDEDVAEADDSYFLPHSNFRF